MSRPQQNSLNLQGIGTVCVIPSDPTRAGKAESAIELDARPVCRPHRQLHAADASCLQRRERMPHQSRADSSVPVCGINADCFTPMRAFVPAQ